MTDPRSISAADLVTQINNGLGGDPTISLAELTAVLQQLFVTEAFALADTVAEGLALKAPLSSPALTDIPTAPTAVTGTNTNQIATTAFVQIALAALADSAPATLDTLNELAAALGDDPDFATTVTELIAAKVSQSAYDLRAQAVDDALDSKVNASLIQSSAIDITAGKLARADYAYSPGNLLGAVSKVGGVPTGAGFERGANVNGEYVRFADGTQICWHTITTSDNGYVTWTYPIAFSSAPKPQFTPQGTAALMATPNAAGSAELIAVNCWDITGSRVIADVNGLAIGRWS